MSGAISKAESFVLERDARGKRIPVFAAAQAGELLGDPPLREYLTEMLCSFVRTNIAVLYRQEGRAWQKRKFSDMDMDDMMALCQLVESELKPRLYKRIADIALFLTGIYPDHASAFVRKPRSQDWRLVPDYEREGRRFYALAARETEPPGPASVLRAIGGKIHVGPRGVEHPERPLPKTAPGAVFRPARWRVEFQRTQTSQPKLPSLNNVPTESEPATYGGVTAR